MDRITVDNVHPHIKKVGDGFTTGHQGYSDVNVLSDRDRGRGEATGVSRLGDPYLEELEPSRPQPQQSTGQIRGGAESQPVHQNRHQTSHRQPHPRPRPSTYQSVNRQSTAMVGKVSERVLAREGKYH